MKDPSYTLPTMQRKLASSDPSQVDAATAFIAVDSNSLGRAILLWQACEAATTTTYANDSSGKSAPRAARFFRPSCSGAVSAGAKL